MIEYLNTFDEFQNKLHTHEMVIIDFTASWCGPCKRISPLVEKLAVDNQDVAFFKVNVDDASSILEHVQIRSMPTFIAYKQGLKVAEFSGANEKALREMLERLKSQ